jgi:DNA-binding transcriptional regulator YhcF (GntR family)
MANNVLKTSADDLYELVRLKKKISVEDAAKILKMPNNTVQALVDFLVEENIFGIEYKFTTPYIYISQEKEKKIDIQSSLAKKLVTKEEFFQKAGKWNISPEKISELWKKYVRENLDSIKEDFYAKANSKNISGEKVDALWKKYMVHL